MLPRFGTLSTPRQCVPRALSKPLGHVARHGEAHGALGAHARAVRLRRRGRGAVGEHLLQELGLRDDLVISRLDGREVRDDRVGEQRLEVPQPAQPSASAATSSFVLPVIACLGRG